MNTKGVEDGITDERTCECGRSLHHLGWLSCVMAGLNTRGIPRSKLPKPAELELKGEGGDTPVIFEKREVGGWFPRKAAVPVDQPSPSAAVPVEERTAEQASMSTGDAAEGIAVRFTGHNCISLLRWMGNPHWSNDMLHSTDNPYVETERGPEVAQIGDWVIKTDSGKLILCRPVDHIEGKAKAVSQEVKE